MEPTRQDVDDLHDLCAELGIRHRQVTANRQHRLHAVPVLLWRPEQIFSEHQIPAHERVASVVRLAIARLDGHQQRPASSIIGMVQIAYPGTVLAEGQMVVIDLPCELQPSS
jgi:hypothetical protein